MGERTYTQAEVDRLLAQAEEVAVKYLRQAQEEYEATITRLLLSQYETTQEAK